MNTTFVSNFYQQRSFINYKEYDSTLVESDFDLPKEKIEIKSMKKVNSTEIEKIIPDIGTFYHQLASELSFSIDSAFSSLITLVNAVKSDQFPNSPEFVLANLPNLFTNTIQFASKSRYLIVCIIYRLIVYHEYYHKEFVENNLVPVIYDILLSIKQSNEEVSMEINILIVLIQESPVLAQSFFDNTDLQKLLAYFLDKRNGFRTIEKFLMLIRSVISPIVVNFTSEKFAMVKETVDIVFDRCLNNRKELIELCRLIQIMALHPDVSQYLMQTDRGMQLLEQMTTEDSLVLKEIGRVFEVALQGWLQPSDEFIATIPKLLDTGDTPAFECGCRLIEELLRRNIVVDVDFELLIDTVLKYSHKSAAAAFDLVCMASGTPMAVGQLLAHPVFEAITHMLESDSESWRASAANLSLVILKERASSNPNWPGLRSFEDKGCLEVLGDAAEDDDTIKEIFDEIICRFYPQYAIEK